MTRIRLLYSNAHTLSNHSVESAQNCQQCLLALLYRINNLLQCSRCLKGVERALDYSTFVSYTIRFIQENNSMLLANPLIVSSIACATCQIEQNSLAPYLLEN